MNWHLNKTPKKRTILKAIWMKSAQNTMNLDGGLIISSVGNQFLGFYWIIQSFINLIVLFILFYYIILIFIYFYLLIYLIIYSFIYSVIQLFILLICLFTSVTLNQRILFSEVWDRVEHGATQKYARVKVQNDIRTSKHFINKQTSPIFNCVTPVSVSLAPLARQLSFIVSRVFFRGGQGGGIRPP